MFRLWPAAVLVVLVGGAGAIGLRHVQSPAEPRRQAAAGEEAPAPAGEARWTRLPTQVTRDPGYQRLPPVERPADINPAPPQSDAPALSSEPDPEAVAETEPAEAAPAEPMSLAERCRQGDADRAECRALREREARAERRARMRSAEAARRREDSRYAPDSARRSALGISPNYDLLR